MLKNIKADDIQNEIKSLQDKLENSNGEHTAVVIVHYISDTIQRLTGIRVLKKWMITILYV